MAHTYMSIYIYIDFGIGEFKIKNFPVEKKCVIIIKFCLPPLPNDIETFYF